MTAAGRIQCAGRSRCRNYSHREGREIVKLIKDSKKKVQASIQGDFLRIAGKDRDTLQDVMQLLRSSDFGIDMQFTNYRTN